MKVVLVILLRSTYMVIWISCAIYFERLGPLEKSKLKSEIFLCYKVHFRDLKPDSDLTANAE